MSEPVATDIERCVFCHRPARLAAGHECEPDDLPEFITGDWYAESVRIKENNERLRQRSSAARRPTWGEWVAQHPEEKT